MGENKEKPTQRTERGITTMFRIMSNNHINLSSMADSKANIMISVNSIIISIMVSVLLGRLAYYKNLTIPTIILITVCLGAIIFPYWPHDQKCRAAHLPKKTSGIKRSTFSSLAISLICALRTTTGQ
ncbi:MAG: hypothetical protein HC867_02165 [Bacteroidia bacterium]|nr:hypothetical protein [Bacteroidia bacterium]